MREPLGLPDSNDIVFAYPPVVVSVYGKGDGQWHQSGPAEQGPEQQMPVLETFFATNTEPEAGP